MWSQVWLLLRRQRTRSLFASGGFLLAACTLILLTTTTQTTALRANQLISQQWRPTYDLVVVPPNTQLPAGQSIPADLLEGYDGGISVQQYEQIKRIPGVEVAAPIAFVGYAQLPTPAIQFSQQPLPPGYYRLNWTLTASNGERTIVERQKTGYYLAASSCDAASSPDLFSSLAQQNIQILGCGSGAIPAVFPSIDTGTFLLAAIDPAAEEQLVHLDQSITSGRMLTSQDSARPDPKYPTATVSNGTSAATVPQYDVPLLFQQQLPGQVALNAQLIRVAPDSLDPQQVLSDGGASYLAGLPARAMLFHGNVPLAQNDPQRFSDAQLSWDGRTWTPSGFSSGGNAITFLYTPSGLTYQPAAAPAGQAEPAYTLVPSETQIPGAVLASMHLPQGVFDEYIKEQGPEVAFRTLRPLPIGESSAPPYVSAYYRSQEVGAFRGDAISSQFSDALNWLPETTYAAPPTVLRYDAQGNPIPPTTLLPTTNPAGFMIQPPLALTTLAAAERMKGDDLISVIRVRISGVSGANAASWQRVENIAQEIQRQTGLRAIVTLGSSPQPTLVYVPGIAKGQNGSTHAIAPLGWVEERWIAVGVALVYLNSLAATQLLLLGAVLLVCLGYTIVTLSSLAAAQRRDGAILSALGWRPRQAARLFLGQALALALLGGLAGIGLACLGAWLIGASPPLVVVAAALPAVLVMALVSALYPLRRLARVRPAEVLRGGGTLLAGDTATATRSTARGRFWWRLPAVFALSLRDLGRSRGRALIAVGSLFCSALLLLVMAESILALHATLQGTLLGNAVLLHTAAPQLAGGVFALVLTFASVADLLLLQVRERSQEIGILRAVGWRPGPIRRLFVQQGVTLALVGAIPGALAAAGVLAIQQAAQHTLARQSAVPIALLALGVVVVLVLVTLAATIPAVRALNRLRVADVFRVE